MGQVSGRSKRLESVISICLLGVLILIGAVIFVKQSKYDMSRYGIGTVDVPKVGAGGSMQGISFEVGALVPAGFETLSKAEIYDSENLYEKIDGKAPLYTEAGFKELTTQRFISASEPDLWVELYIYDMGNIKNAFGVYSAQRRDKSEAFASIKFAYKTSNGLYFVHGRYYIEIVGSLESGELFKAIAEVAQRLKTSLAVDTNASIPELAFFPQDNLVPNSFKRYAVSAFGCEKLTDIFTARYKVGGEVITAFISKRADSKEAESIAKSYRNFLTENGAMMKNTANKILAGRIMDLYGATEIVFTVGPFVGGVHEAEEQGTAEKLAEELIMNLRP